MLEYFWYILASVLAGVGTGLVGLSAATVMVPILIVLCPSFAGETGAYQATYIKHKNIGLRRGWIMLVVFTAFLGMEPKSAVDTSTFIMTFTALIASVSHILIHPAILLERWPVLVLCMAVATAVLLALHFLQTNMAPLRK